MPRRFLTNAERERLRRFPTNIAPNDIITYFTLTQADLTEIRKRTGDHNRLGFAMQLCALRYLGFCPEDLTTAPADVVVYVARQFELELGVEPEALKAYGERAQTRTDNLRTVERYLGFRQASAEDLDKLFDWLVERALEHDRPTLLLQMACEKLHREKFIRPSITHSLEPMVLRARSFARQETFRRLAPILTDDLRVLLDELLTVDLTLGITPLTWLRQPATSNSPNAIQAVLKKLAYLKEWEVNRWNLIPLTLNPNRLKFLAQLGRKSTNQALQRTPEERRYSILIAFLRQSLVDITDEAIDMFDRCLADAYARARRDLDEFRESVARATNEKLALFREIGRVILDEQIEDDSLRAVIYQRIPKEILQAAVEECNKIIRPLDDSYFDFLESRYNYIRQFAPVFLDAFTFQFQCNPESEPLLEAVDLLRRLNAEGRRNTPDEAPIDFVPPKWRPYVIDENYHLDRHYYELCVLWELRNALRAGDVWLEESRRYANPESYLIPKDQWLTLREEVCQQLGVPEDGATRLEERGAELEALLTQVDLMLKHDGKDGKVRMDGDDLVVSPLSAEERPESAMRLEQQIDQRLPLIDLSDLLIEVDSWTHFTQHLEHAAGSEPRSLDLLPHLYASIIAQGCNLGRTQMAQMADLSEDLLAWCSNWYIRDDTLKAAVAAIVNFQYNQPLSQFWGGGILSSSDGQRFPVSGKVRNAEALPRYFGYGRGVTFYTWTSDQFSQYGTKVISATVRDATYVLDEILDNETELDIVEHTTDTSGYTEIIFALFDLLGMQFSPRIRDIGTQRLYRVYRLDYPNQNKTYPNLEPQLNGKINQEFILRRWDDLLRVAGSLQRGWVTASLFISKLQSYPRRNVLTWALQEYGRLVKTIFILRYLESEEYRRRINTQLNKGEALHGLRQFLFFANGGKIRRKQEEDQNNVASCLNLITNAVVAWNTVYMTAAIEQLKTEGYPVREEDIAHLSPARYEHLNPYGKYYFDIDAIDVRFGITQLRPLRQPKSVCV